ncbi:MAG: GGDEF domain-containing protein [Candidatus Eisenbacteria bacterium]|nr:GGDEF domain-containing protein [Candidatus Eisenbacteria bacterium]
MSRIDPSPSPLPSPPGMAPLLAGALVLAILPWASALFRDGSLAESPRALLSSIAASLIAVAFAAWVIVLLRRERATARRHLADLEALTLTDALTGLGNRRALERELARAMLRSRRMDHPLSLLFLDVDDLKTVNDRFGHSGGDETLRVVANVTRACSRDGTDMGYRVGGDEFVLIVLTDFAGAEVLAGRIRQGFTARSPYQSTLSVGVMEWDGAMSAGELLSEADQLMYRSKQAHRAPPTTQRHA